jgi:hypothetical protein
MNDPWKITPTSIRLEIRNPERNEMGEVRLGRVISKDNLDLFLSRAKQSPEYAAARDKYEFRLSRTKGQVFLELKRRSPGLFGKVFGFLGRARRTTERNDAMAALTRFNALGQADANRRAASPAAFAATSRADARRFHSDLAQAREQGQETGRRNARLWSRDVSPDDKARLLSEAANRAGMADYIELCPKEIVLQKVVFALQETEADQLGRDDVEQTAARTFDKYWQQQKQKLALLDDMNLALSVDQLNSLKRELLGQSASMNSEYFRNAGADGELLSQGIKQLVQIPSDQESARREAAVELMTALRNSARDRGFNGSQEYADLAPLVAYAAFGKAGDNLAGLDNLNDTLSYVSDLCTDIQMNDDSPDNVDKGIAAAYLRGLVLCLTEIRA